MNLWQICRRYGFRSLLDILTQRPKVEDLEKLTGPTQLGDDPPMRQILRLTDITRIMRVRIALDEYKARKRLILESTSKTKPSHQKSLTEVIEKWSLKYEAPRVLPTQEALDKFGRDRERSNLILPYNDTKLAPWTPSTGEWLGQENQLSASKALTELTEADASLSAEAAYRTILANEQSKIEKSTQSAARMLTSVTKYMFCALAYDSFRNAPVAHPTVIVGGYVRSLLNISVKHGNNFTTVYDERFRRKMGAISGSSFSEAECILFMQTDQELVNDIHSKRVDTALEKTRVYQLNADRTMKEIKQLRGRKGGGSHFDKPYDRDKHGSSERDNRTDGKGKGGKRGRRRNRSRTRDKRDSEESFIAPRRPEPSSSSQS